MDEILNLRVAGGSDHCIEQASQIRIALQHPRIPGRHRVRQEEENIPLRGSLPTRIPSGRGRRLAAPASTESAWDGNANQSPSHRELFQSKRRRRSSGRDTNRQAPRLPNADSVHRIRTSDRRRRQRRPLCFFSSEYHGSRLPSHRAWKRSPTGAATRQTVAEYNCIRSKRPALGKQPRPIA